MADHNDDCDFDRHLQMGNFESNCCVPTAGQRRIQIFSCPAPTHPSLQWGFGLVGLAFAKVLEPLFTPHWRV